MLLLICRIILITNKDLIMVGREDKTSVSVAVTSVGQVTIPKMFRDALGIKDRVNIRRRGDEIVIQRAKTGEEIFAEIDSMWTPEQRERIKANAGKLAKELIAESLETPEGQEYFRQTFMGGLEDEE